MAYQIIDLDSSIDVDDEIGHGLPAWEHEALKIWRAEKNKFERQQMMNSRNSQPPVMNEDSDG